jgi:hypothetical protein
MPCPYCGKKVKSKAPAGVQRYERLGQEQKRRQNGGATEERVLVAVFGELVVEEIGQVVVIGEDVGFGGGVHGALARGVWAH